MSNQTINRTSNACVTYTVKRGDSLWKIAKMFYKKGSKNLDIYRANEEVIGKNANLIIIGTKLKIPIFETNQNNKSNQQSRSIEQKNNSIKNNDSNFSVVPVANAFKQAAYLLHPTTSFKVEHKIMPPVIIQNLNCSVELSLTLKGDVTIGKEGALHGISFNMNTLQADYYNVYRQFLGYYTLKPSVGKDGISLDITSPAGQTSNMKVDLKLNPSVSQCYASTIETTRIGEFNVSSNIGYCIEIKSNCRDLSEFLIPIPAYDTVPVYAQRQNPYFSDSLNYSPLGLPNNELPSFTLPAANSQIANIVAAGAFTAGLILAGKMAAGAAVALAGAAAVPFAAAVLLIPVLRTQFNTSSSSSL